MKYLLHKLFIDDTFSSQFSNQFTRIGALLVYILSFGLLAWGFGSSIYYLTTIEFKGLYVFGMIFTGIMSYFLLRLVINLIIEIFRKFRS